MPEQKSTDQLAAELELQKKQFEHYKGLVEDAFRKLDDRVAKLEKSRPSGFHIRRGPRPESELGGIPAAR